MVKSVTELIKEASEAVAHVPENLQEIAFSKAFDALLAEQQGDVPNRTGGSGKRQHRGKPNPTSDKPDRSQLDQLNRTAHSEITHDGTALSNALRVLLAARDELGIDGLTASEIAHVLMDKFRCRISRQAVSQALNDASQYVNRHKEGNAVIFRIMSRGEEHLGNLSSEEEAATKSAKGGKRRKKNSQSKAMRQDSKANKKTASKNGARKKSPGAMAALTQLYDADFFSSTRSSGTIIQHLKQNLGRTYKPNEMSPPLLRYLRSGKLSRTKNADNQYEYQNA